MKFYKCNICGQIIAIIKPTESIPHCCGHEMERINSQVNEEGLNEKHIPTYKIEKNKCIVQIGETLHPMINDHYIEWILLVTNKGIQRKCLKPGDLPKVTFLIDKYEEVQKIYAYCNIHSLWVYKVDQQNCGCKYSCCHKNS